MARRGLIATMSVLASIALAGGLYVVAARYVQKDDTPITQSTAPKTDKKAQKILSRGVMELAISLGRTTQLSPPESARRLAYVASGYAASVDKNLPQKDSLLVSQKILEKFYPEADVATGISKVATEYVVSPHPAEEPVPTEVSGITEQYFRRMSTDEHDLAWEGTVPLGSDKWSGKDPESPRAGDWQRWAVMGGAVIARPPSIGSDEQKKDLESVRELMKNRTDEDEALVKFWHGSEGNVTADTQWQDQLYEIIKTDLPDDKNKADAQYATMQKYLAITIADSILESWRVKFTFWTPRPSMYDAAIKPLLPDPNYPAYPSALAASSSAAAQVLTALSPDHKAEWFELAENAANSERVSGTHMPADVSSGKELGELVGQQITTTQKLTKL